MRCWGEIVIECKRDASIRKVKSEVIRVCILYMALGERERRTDVKEKALGRERFNSQL